MTNTSKTKPKATVSSRDRHARWMESCRETRDRIDRTPPGGGGLRPDLKRGILLGWLREGGLEVVDASESAAHGRIEELQATHWDVIVSGGGPAGLGAAWKLAERGLRVLLLERALLLDTDRTWAEPDDIVEQLDLGLAVRCVHVDTGFRDYFGLDYPSRIDYCILDQEIAAWILASRLPRGPFQRGIKGEVVVVENCELTAFSRVEQDGVPLMRARTVRNGFRLMPWSQAKSFPRALACAGTSGFYHAALDPWVKIDTFLELDAPAKTWDNPRFHADLLVDGGGHRSALARSFHKAREADVWKCLVYEFEHLPAPQEQTIWDMAFPTATSANFWVDVASDTDVAAGVMVLTRATPEFPEAHPSKFELESYMGKWLNIRKLTGRFVRERSGLIPMTDLSEPAAHAGVVFIGASACRQIPNTGFGFFPSIREAELLAETVGAALVTGRGTPSAQETRAYDLAWIAENEFRSTLAMVLQDFHYALRTDERFHEFSERCTDVPAWLVKSRILDRVDLDSMRELTRVFAGAPGLLDPRGLDPKWMPRLKRDMANMLLSILQTCRWRRLLCMPSTHPMFRLETDPEPGWLSRPLRFLRRDLPFRVLLHGVVPVFFSGVFRKLLGSFGGKPAMLLAEPLLRWAFGTWEDRYRT